MKVEVRLTCFDEKELEEVLAFVRNKKSSDNTKQDKLPSESVCSKCGKAIVDEDGHTAVDIIKYSKYKYKKILCPKCQKEEG